MIGFLVILKSSVILNRYFRGPNYEVIKIRSGIKKGLIYCTNSCKIEDPLL